MTSVKNTSAAGETAQPRAHAQQVWGRELSQKHLKEEKYKTH